MTLQAEALVAARDPGALLARVGDHLADHGTVLAAEADRRLIGFPFGAVGLALRGGMLVLSASAAEMEGLLTARASLASHILEFAEGEALDIAWSGDGAEVMAPPNYRELLVTATEAVTPRMRRIHFAAEDLGRFSAISAIHVRLAFPVEEGPIPQPILGQDGLPGWPKGGPEPVWRKYTIRAIDVAKGTLAVDFVLHDHAGPGSAWAARAKAGDRIGMAGPGGRGLAEAGFHVFLADETGLPAVARMLEALPPETEGHAVIEIADAGERQPLRHPPGVSLLWLMRDEAGTPSLVAAAKALDLPARPDIHVWAAAEFEEFRALRKHVRGTLGLSAAQHLVVSYWRRGEPA